MEQEKLTRESYKLWEQFATTYNSMMFEAMEKAIQQSDTIKQQMDAAVQRSLKGWKFPTAGNQAEVVEALGNLSKQIEALGDKVDRLEKSIGKKAAK